MYIFYFTDQQKQFIYNHNILLGWLPVYKHLDFFDAGIKDIITAVFRYQTSHGLALMLIYINKNYIFCVPLAHEKLP